MDERVERDLTNKVGYAKPPKHTRFTKGRSGNPKGRPTGSKNLGTMMIEELTHPVAIVENGKRTKIPKIRAALRQKRAATTKPIPYHPKDYTSLELLGGLSQRTAELALTALFRPVVLDRGIRAIKCAVVENRRGHDARVVQRQVLYLGEINDR
jgi:Family of unknown function (DUF5681)